MLLHDILKPYNLILASNSPRRRQLLGDAGIEFALADRYEVDEVFPDSLPAEDVPAYLSELKSLAYPGKLNSNDILITADTVVILRGKILGKPKDRDDAVRMLSGLSGEAHTVVTGVTIRTLSGKLSFSSSTEVFFRTLTKEEIAYYVDNFRPYDKAGAYGIQEWIGYAGVERIEGSYFNVMGLPVQRLYTELSLFIKKHL